MNFKVIDNERKSIRKELKKLNLIQNGIILILQPLNKSTNSVMNLLNESTKIFPNSKTQFIDNLNSQEKMNYIINEVKKNKIIITTIKLENDSKLLETLRVYNKKDYCDFLNKIFLIIK